MDTQAYYQTNNKENRIISLSEYNQILKSKLNPKLYNLTNLNLIKRLKDNGIEINKISGCYEFNIDTIPALLDKILKDIKVVNINEESKYCITKTEFKPEDLNRFIDIAEVEAIIDENYKGTNALYKVKRHLSYISIPFIHYTKRYYDKEMVLKFINDGLANGNIWIKGIEADTKDAFSLEEKLWLSMDECINILKEKFPTLLSGKSLIGLSTENLRIKIRSRYTHIRCITEPIFKIHADDIDALIQAFIDDMDIVNVDPVNDTCFLDKYNISKKDISIEMLQSYVTKEYYEETIGCEHHYFWGSVTKRIPCIKTENLIRHGVFFRKDAVDYIKYIHDNGVTIKDAISNINKKLGSDFTWAIISKIIKDSEEIKIFECVPDFSKKAVFVMLKEDIPKLEEILSTRMIYDDCNDLCECMDKFLELNSNFQDLKIRNTINKFNDFIISVNDNINPKYLTNIFREFRATYNLLTTYLEKELYLYTNDEIHELINFLENLYLEGEVKKYAIDRFTAFYNYLSQNGSIGRASGSENQVLPYELESYFAVLGNVINFMQNKEDVINKLINETIGRVYANSLLYILSHYTACWRNTDICEKLPNVNLKLIGFETGDEFIDWFKKEDSVFTEEMGRIICTSVEDYLVATKAVASKNNGSLLLYVSKWLYPIYGLLLCICEANRQKRKGDKILIKLNSNIVAISCNKIDESILKPIYGKFSNRMANKSFETYISEKSEEWNLGIGHLMGAVARGHKINEKLISETTVIYINKDVDIMSLRAFSSGIFSIAKKEFLSLIDESYEDKPIIEQTEIATHFPMSNYEIEILLKNVSRKVIELKAFFDTYLTTNKIKKGTVRQLIFSKNAISKHENAKCLWRAYESAKNNSEIDLSKGFLKTCPYRANNSCIGCPLLITEIYFLYEFEERLLDVIKCLETANEDFDKLIYIQLLSQRFFPIIYEAMSELGPKRVKEIVSIDRMSKVYKESKQLLDDKEKEGKLSDNCLDIKRMLDFKKDKNKLV